MAIEIVIKNEQDAWEWFKKAVDGDISIDNEPISLKFQGWPILDLKYQGNDFYSSVPTRVMPTLLDAQKEINQIYAQVRYNSRNTRKLTKEDRERLELVVKVDNGSSKYETNFAETLTEIFRSAVGHMDSIHILVFLLTTGLSLTSAVAWKAWLSNREREKEIKSRVEMSELEKEKLALFTKAEKIEPTIKDLIGSVDDFRNLALSQLKEADALNVSNYEIPIDGEYASRITHKPREQSIDKRIDGEFIIESVKSGSVVGYWLAVKSSFDSQKIKIFIPETLLTADQMEILKDNEWAKKPVYLEINAKVIKGVVTSAVLVSATKIEKKTVAPVKD